jgi:hypothetical protein
MAAVAAFRTALRAIGFSIEAARTITDDQEISSIEELKMLFDNDVVELCKALRRPGGTIINPAAGQFGQIPNPGINIPLRAVENLKMAAYYARHHDRISRPLLPAGLTLANVRLLRPLKDHELAHQQPDEVPVIDEKDMVRTMDAIESYLRSYLGEKKVPLAYIIREDPAPLLYAADPSTNY